MEDKLILPGDISVALMMQKKAKQMQMNSDFKCKKHQILVHMCVKV